MNVPGAGTERRPPSPRQTTLGARLCVLIVVGACALSYSNALRNDFVFDDVQLVKDNEAIRSIASVPEIFSGNLWGVLGKASNYYRPLPPLLYMATYGLFGLTPWAFHLLNIVLHTSASVLVFLIASRLLGWSDRRAAAGPALLAALVFAVHPLHTEAVTWIAGIMDVSSTCFSLLSFYCFVRATDGPFLGGAYILSLVSFFLATLCKEPALLLPLLILVYSLGPGPADRSLAVAAKRSFAYFAVAGLYLAMRAHALRGLAPLTRGEGGDVGVYETVINIPSLFALYLWKLLLPLHQNVLYHVPPVTSLAEPRALLGLLVVVGFAAAAFRARRSGTLFLSLAFLALPLGPALYLPGLTQKPVNAFAERYAYFASVGFVLLVGAGLLWAGSRSRRAYAWAVGAVAVVTVVFAGLTVQRNAIWKDNLTLWSDSVTKSPESAFAHENLGYALFYAGRPGEGARELRTALSLDPGIPRSIVATGVAYGKKGLLKKAILEFSIALMFDPDMVDAHYNLGLALQEKGWLDAAIAHYERALAINPAFQEAHVNAGIAHAERGNLDKAVDHFRAAVDLAPADRAARHNLARAYAAKGLEEQAEVQRRIAESLDDRPRVQSVVPR